ncbi:hypothetical protein B0H12DRAFT_1083664 [Mycena haematopus]|nr:hypothetical protein B0H12DRAFT_1083664 [Mycena haematopus]
MAENERKTRKRRKDTAVNEDIGAVAKAKKEKRKLEDTADGAEDSGSTPPEPEKKKHKKNKTGFPDPGDDPALSDQANKALSYAFLQFRRRSKWKFSKPRQNWLVRNVWSDKIPDLYFPLTVQYLSNVQGNVRENLIKDCRSALSASSDPQNEGSAETAPQAQLVVKSDQMKHARARALLDALEAALTELPKS